MDTEPVKQPRAEDFRLSQNYPNPFNPETRISYTIPTGGYVSLKVYDVMAKLITTLADETQSAGTHEVEFNGKNLPSGVYYYTLHSGDFSVTKKFVLLR